MSMMVGETILKEEGKEGERKMKYFECGWEEEEVALQFWIIM